MAQKEIALLKNQIEKLQDKNFDLEAWKQQSLIFTERIFGKDSSKVKMIKELHYDYSSWNLRDVSGAGKSKDPVKMQAAEILEAAILELEQLGLPQERKTNEKLWELLNDELTGKQIKDIEQLLKSENTDKQEKVAVILSNLKNENLVSILSQLLLS